MRINLTYRELVMLVLGLSEGSRRGLFVDTEKPEVRALLIRLNKMKDEAKDESTGVN